MGPFAFSGQRGDVLGCDAELLEFAIIETRGHDDEAIALETSFKIF
jgi:hypothetical protein